MIVTARATTSSASMLSVLHSFVPAASHWSVSTFFPGKAGLSFPDGKTVGSLGQPSNYINDFISYINEELLAHA